MRTRKLSNVVYVSSLFFLILLNPLMLTSRSSTSQGTQNNTSANSMASPPIPNNMTFTSGKTLNLTTGTTVNFTLGCRMNFSSGITIQFTDVNSTPIMPGFCGQLLTITPPQFVVEPFSWWEILTDSGTSGIYFRVYSVDDDIFSIDQMAPFAMYPLDHGENITAELRISSIAQDSQFFVRDPPNWTPDVSSWWRIASPVAWRNVLFHVDGAFANGTFHIDQVNGTIPPLEHSYIVTAEQAVTGINQSDYFIAKDPVSTPEPCSWWEIVEPKQPLGYGFHVDWKDANGTFRIDQVTPSNIVFSTPISELVVEKRISAIQPGMNFTYVSPSGYVPKYNDWWEILYPEELESYEFRISSTYGGRIYVAQVDPASKTLNTSVHKLIVEKKIHTIAAGDSFKVVNPQSWVPEVRSWWKVVLPNEWVNAVFCVDSNDGATSFHLDYVSSTLTQPTPPPWNVTAEPTLVHDIAVTSVSPNLTSVYQGWTCPIFVTVENRGNFNETFDVDVEYIKYSGSPVTTSPVKVQDLQPGGSKVLCFYWITKRVPLGTYTIWANAHIDNVPTGYEINLNNNDKYASTVTVKTPPNLCLNEGFVDYALNGMPDFDQRQDNWKNPITGNWSYCGPTAIANSLWWYDSKFEPKPQPSPPPEQSDEFPLVSNYVPQMIDDHDPANVQMLITYLAELMDTDGQRTGTTHNGTTVKDMKTGLAQYLSWTSVNPLGDVNGDGTVNQTDIDILNNAMNSTPGMPNWNMAADIYPITQHSYQWPDLPHADNIVNASDLELVEAHLGETGLFSEYSRDKPDHLEIENDIKQGRTVILSIGYWYCNFSTWVKNPKSHFVTVVGINASQQKIFVSDPIFDAFETSLSLPEGYSPIPHTYQHNATIHNNAEFTSYDGYLLQCNPLVPTAPPCPGGNWALQAYPGIPSQGLFAVIESAIVTSSLGIHDLTIASVKTSKDGCKPMPIVCQNCSMTITITATNRGTFTEPLNITSYINSSIAISENIILESGKSTTITTVWNTTGISKGNYSISAYVQAVPFEFHKSDNNLTWGSVQVTMLGDINGNQTVAADGIVDIFDITRISLVFSSVTTDPKWDPNADINNDGAVDIFDLVVVAVHFGEKDP